VRLPLSYHRHRSYCVHPGLWGGRSGLGGLFQPSRLRDPDGDRSRYAASGGDLRASAASDHLGWEAEAAIIDPIAEGRMYLDDSLNPADQIDQDLHMAPVLQIGEEGLNSRQPRDSES
jgi:hypothetical protein